MITTNPVLWIVVCGAFAFFLGALLVWLFREREIVALGTGLVEEKLRSGELTERLLHSEAELTDARCGLAAANERVSTLQADERVRGEFAIFIQQDLGALRSSLEHVAALQTSLRDAVRTTNDAIGQLRTALQNPRVPGSWGEISLDRIVECAGSKDGNGTAVFLDGPS